MPEGLGEVGFPIEAGSVLGVGRPVRREELQCIAARQSRMLREAYLSHPPDPSKRIIMYPAKIWPFVNGMDEY
jgi:hypothetical protein